MKAEMKTRHNGKELHDANYHFGNGKDYFNLDQGELTYIIGLKSAVAIKLRCLSTNLK